MIIIPPASSQHPPSIMNSSHDRRSHPMDAKPPGIAPITNARQHRERYGRRPTNYTASYSPSPHLIQTAARARAASNAFANSGTAHEMGSSAVSGLDYRRAASSDEDDDDERSSVSRRTQNRFHGDRNALHASGAVVRGNAIEQHQQRHISRHKSATGTNIGEQPMHHQHHQQQRGNRGSFKAHRCQSSDDDKSPPARYSPGPGPNNAPHSPSSHSRSNRNSNGSSHELTEQQIGEYAGKRAMMRLEQEFASSSLNRNSKGKSTSRHSGVLSIMDRKKLARVPQVNKIDLIIGEYLGRGNFSDVFEVTWTPPEHHDLHARLRHCLNASAGRASSGMTEGDHISSSDDDSSRSNDMDESNLEEALSLACSNDLHALYDLGQRRSISQIRTLQKGSFSKSSKSFSSQSALMRNPNILALKCLRPAVRAQPRKYVIGAEDLAHETALLACLDHPNIIQLYGRAEGCFSTAFQSSSSSKSSGHRKERRNSNDSSRGSSEGYFIILDRLMATLTGRIDEWKNECRAINGAVVDNVDCPPLPSEKTLSEHIYKRLKVAYCIADALEYLHSRHVVFRDLKPANVGFDCNDCVKMFDFGFATSIAPFLNDPAYQQQLKEQQREGGRQGGYGPLTETCGTRRYMAPEVALKLGYGKEVDVYSFGMLLWEICALEKPFDSIQSVDAFHDIVVLCGKRPSLNIDPLWTPSLKNLMARCWSTDPLDRPTMVQVKSMLCNVLRDMNVSEMESKNGRSGGGEGEGGQQGSHPNFLNKWRRRMSI